MKLIFKLTAPLLCLAFIIPSCGTNTANKNQTSADTTSTVIHRKKGEMKMADHMMGPMDKMMVTMKNLKSSGDFDIDFATTMILHHQMAIDMSEVYLPKSKDTKMKAMAGSIIDAQQQEIVQMKNFLNTHVSSMTLKKNDEDKLNEMMKTMMDQMHNIKLTGNPDNDYVMEMIPHHQAAVNMAKQELLLGAQNNLQEMAKKMIIDQNKEIEQFKSWLSHTN